MCKNNNISNCHINMLHIYVFLSSFIMLAIARPEPPKSYYGPPPAQPTQHHAQPQVQYSTLSSSKGQFLSLPVYNSPAPFYGPPQAAPAPAPAPPPPQQYYHPAQQQPQPQPQPQPQHHQQIPSAIVTKNVYIHVPPEEPEIFRHTAPIQAAPPNKHYKIIFIKAPSPPAPQRLVVPPTVQDEHKTLVYVLVKKPEEPEQLVLPEPTSTEPSKPEVYFIKYKERHNNKPASQYGPPLTSNGSAVEAVQPSSLSSSSSSQHPASEYGPPNH